MKQKNRLPVGVRIRKFFTQLFDKIDKKIESEAKSKPCCCKPAEGKDKTCCS